MAEQEFDLFGDPVRQSNGRRGRPAHVATQENRNKVIMLLAFGWGNERIAAALYISPPTLRRYYFSELKARDIQRDRLDLKRYMQVFTAAEQGNVGAMRLLDQLIAKSDLMLTTGKIADAQKRASRKPETEGKKAQERLAAQQVVSGEGGEADEWDDDLTPGAGMH
ncbi:MAG: resolvase [Leisingera sp.]